MLGQSPPAGGAELFSSGIVSSRLHEHSCLIITPEGDQMFWSVGFPDIHVIMTMKQESGGWSEPAPAPFSGVFWDDFPALSPDGRILYFASKRPLPGENKSSGSYSLWQCRLGESGWGEAEPADELVPGWEVIMPSFANDGTLYFFARKEEGTGGFDIYRSEPGEEAYQPPELLGPTINTEGHEAFVTVTPDEKYLLFTNWGTNDYDGLMISESDGSGGWKQAVPAGDSLNPQQAIRFYSFSPCGAYLFFNCQRLRSPEAFSLAVNEDVFALADRVENGGGNFYWVSFGQLLKECF